jgi:hypothetical protein
MEFDYNDVEIIHQNNVDEHCIICLDETNFIKNILCDCVYYYHINCFFDWIKSKDAKCMLCKKPVVVNPIINNNINIQILNININPNIVKPIFTSVPMIIYKHNHSIISKRIEKYLFKVDYTFFLNLSPNELLDFLKTKINIPRQNFRYKWKIIHNNLDYTISLTYDIELCGIIYEITRENLCLNNSLLSNSIPKQNQIIIINNYVEEKKEEKQDEEKSDETSLYRSYPTFRRHVSIFFSCSLVSIMLYILTVISASHSSL